VRVLYVTNGFPYPLTSGYLRHWYLINELAGAGHEIALLSLARSVGAEDRAAVESVCASVTVVPASGGSRFRRRLATAVPAAPVDGPAAELGRRGATLAAAWRPHAVLFSGKRTYPALGPLPELPVVSDLCDATSSRLRAGLRHGSPVMAPARLVEWAGIRHVERRLLARSSSVLFASARDRDAVVPAGGGGRAVVVPNGVDLTYWQRSGDWLGRDVVVFTGAMDYGPNADAALQLVRAVWPLVRAERPGAELLLVGRDPGPDLRRAADAMPGVTVTGTVPDVRPFLERASVFAAPLRVGAGIQNKVLEALAMEVPVVASELAAGGLRTPEGQDPPLAVADGPAATATAVVAALRRADTDATPAAEGRAFVAAHFSWRRSGELVADALERATVGAGRR
jgi:glycosyltransferase involved in cell wall biosynthesis